MESLPKRLQQYIDSIQRLPRTSAEEDTGSRLTLELVFGEPDSFRCKCAFLDSPRKLHDPVIRDVGQLFHFCPNRAAIEKEDVCLRKRQLRRLLPLRSLVRLIQNVRPPRSEQPGMKIRQRRDISA